MALRATRFSLVGVAPLLVGTVIVLLGLPAPSALAQPMMAEAEWQRFETENFEVLYPKGYEASAGHCAMLAEEAYRHLTPLFQWDPERRITMIVSDGNDRHNGFATILPRPTIQLELYPPDRRQTLYSPDYLRQVIVHELAHIMQLDQTDELRGAMRRVFGTVVPGRADPVSVAVALLALPPNAAAPTWFLEGGAQWAETEFSKRGRGESPLHSAYLRALVREDRSPAVDEAVLASPDWPFGNAAYLWGLAVMRHWQAAHGTDGTPIPAELTREVAQGIPGWIEPASQEQLGQWVNRAWEEGTEAIITEQREIMQLIRRSGKVTREIRLTPEKLVAFNPLPSPDGRWVHFVGNPPDKRAAMYRLDMQSGEVERLPVRLSTSSRIWRLPGAPGWLLFTRLEPAGTDQWRVVLYRVRADGTEPRRIARGRFNESAPEPGMPGRLWTIKPVTDRGEQRARLVAYDDLPLHPERYRASLERVRKRIPSQPYFVPGAMPEARREEVASLPGIMHSPTPLGDGRVAVVHEHEEMARILLFGVPAGEEEQGRLSAVPGYRVLHTQRNEIRHLIWDGSREELLFVSGERGVLNLHALSVSAMTHAGRERGRERRPQAQPRRLTNAMVGYMEAATLSGPTPETDGVLAVSLDADGPHLVLLGPEELATKTEPLPQMMPAWPYLNARPPRLGAQPADLEAFGEPELERHGLFAGFTFQHWHPFLEVGSSEASAAGAALRFADPLRRVSLDVAAGYDWIDERPFGAFSLAMQPAAPTFTFGGRYLTQRFPERFVLDADGSELDYYEDLGRLSLGASLPLRELDVTWELGAQVELEWRGTAESLMEVPQETPTSSLEPFRGWRTGLLGSLRFSSLTRYPRSLGPEDGLFATLTARYRPPVLDQAEHWFGVSLRAGGVVALPGGPHQLELHGAMGYSVERKTLQDGFAAGGHHGTFRVRGYPSNEQLGRFAFAAGAAYRTPLIQIYRGLATLPLFVRTLTLELFAEAGRAFDHGWREVRSDQLLASLGAELQLQLAAAGNRAAQFDLVVGYAYASERSPLSDRHVFYLSFGLPLF